MAEEERLTTEERLAAIIKLRDRIDAIKKEALDAGCEAHRLQLHATASTLGHTVADGCQQARNFTAEAIDKLTQQWTRSHQEDSNGSNRSRSS